MAIATSGSPVNITLAAGKVLSITTAVDTLIEGSIAGVKSYRKQTSSNATIGAYLIAVDFTVTVTSGYATVVQADPAGDVLNVDAKTNYDDVSDVASKSASVSLGGGSSGVITDGRASITVIGDSIAAYGDGIQAGGTVKGATSQSIPAWCMSQIASKLPYYILANRAVGGVTIDTVISSQLNTALVDSSDILWVHAGVNNLNPAIDATTPTVAEIVSRMDNLLTIASNVPLVILDAITPLATGSISGAYPRRTDIPLVNAGYKAIAAKYANVVFNDVYTPLAQDATSGLAIANVNITDGIHLTSYGAKLAGFASYLNVFKNSSIGLRRFHKPTVVYQLPRITGSGGTSTPAGGTINGAVATGWNVQIATNQAGVVITAAVDEVNAKQTLRIQNGNASSTVVRFQLASFALFSGFSIADVMRWSGAINVLTTSGLMRQDLAFQENPSGTTVTLSSLQKSNQEPTPIFPPTGYDMKLTGVGALTAADTTTNVVWTLEVAAGGDVLVNLYDMQLEKVVSY